jgi:hypothetical protein
VFAFEGDLIKYSRHYWDMTELLGAIEPPDVEGHRLR